MTHAYLSAIIAILAIVTSPLQAQFGEPKTQAELFIEYTSVIPGQRFSVAVELTHEEHWHSYFINDGLGFSIIPSAKWKLPETWAASELLFPAPHEFAFSGAKVYGYEGTNYLFTEITVPQSATIGEKVELTVDSSWQVCDDSSCLPPSSQDFTFSLTIADTAVKNSDYSKVDDYRIQSFPTKDHPKDWKISAAETTEGITLSITGNLPEDLEFFEYDKQIDVQGKRDVKHDGATHTFTATRNEGNDLGGDPGPKLANLRGILYTSSEVAGSDNHAFWIDVPLGGSDEAVAPPVATTAQNQPSPDEPNNSTDQTEASEIPSALDAVNSFSDTEIAEMAKRYDVSAPIDFVTIDQIDDEGNLLNREIEKKGLFTFLLLAFIGGMILNLMPCIFPVLGVKILGFAQLSGNDPKKIKLHGVAFSAGMVISMWILGGILLAVKASTGTISWGQQMGDPYFVGIMIIVLTLFGLNLYGLFEIGTSLTGAGGKLQSKKGYQGSFFSGVMTTLIATPCSGPFLGATMGFALQQTAPVTMLIFTVFALGISSPYLILSFVPALINKLPRPGAWMVTFKKIMAFPLLATAAFLMQSFGKQTGAAGLSWLAMGLVVIALAAFIYGQWGAPFTPKLKRYSIGWGLSGCIAALGIMISYDAMSHKGEEIDNEEWTMWHPGIVPHSRSKGRIVWMDYTADW
ncbi:MAG: DsbC/DsbD-like thiol-disulfide interchange protein/cytochrome c biogenesis protein CcdA [Crocinitomicaceae bacterium]|jgi:DsbC/DsbD-like thiol-disulfide interchange protein/cytochrome c biogenesis protein CcdA